MTQSELSFFIPRPERTGLLCNNFHLSYTKQVLSTVFESRISVAVCIFIPITTVGAAPGANCTAIDLFQRLSKCTSLQSAIASEVATDSDEVLNKLCKYVELEIFYIE